MPTPGEEKRTGTPRRAVNPRNCGRPPQELAATNPRIGGHQHDDWQGAVLFLLGVQRQALPVGGGYSSAEQVMRH